MFHRDRKISVLLIAAMLSLMCISVGRVQAQAAFQAAGTAVSWTGTGNTSVPWPAHQEGDIALLFVESTGGQAATLAVANGFAAVTNSPQSTGTTTNGTRLTVFWARATSASMSSPQVTIATGDHGHAVILTYRNVIAVGNPWGVNPVGGVKAAASTAVTVTGLTTSINYALVVQAVARDNDNAAAAFSAQTNGNLSAIVERYDAGTANGNGGGLGIWEGLNATDDAIGNTTATVTSSINAFMTIELRPGVYYSRASANWDTGSTWSNVGCGGATADQIPTAGSQVVICNGHTVTLNTNSASLASLMIHNGGTLNIGNNNTARTLTVNGNASNDGTLQYNNNNGDHNINISGAFTNGGTFTTINNTNGGVRTLTVTGLIDNPGTFRFAGRGNAGEIMVVNANGGITNSGTFDVNTGSNNTHTLNIATDVVNTGTFNLATDANSLATTTFTGGGTHNITGAGAMTFHNTTVNNNLIVDKTAGVITQSGTFTVNGDLTITAGTLNLGNSVSVAGATDVSGTLGITSTTGTASFTGAVVINSGGTWNVTVNEDITMGNSLTNDGSFISGGGTYTFQTTADATLDGDNSLVFAGPVAINANRTSNTDVTITGALTGSASLTNSSGRRLRIAGASTITGLNATAINNTVEYFGTIAQTVKTTDYYHLEINKSSNPATTTTGTINIAGNLTVTAGTLNLANTTVTVAASGSTSISGTLGITSVTGTKTFGSDVTVNVGGIWNHTVNSPVAMNGNLTNNGTFTANAGAAAIYTFGGASAQAITGTNGGTTSIPRLTLNNANGLALTGTHSLTVSTQLTLDNGRITTGSNILFVSYTTGNGAIANANADRFVVGNLRKAYTANATQTRAFEVGTETGGVRYAPVSITLVVPAGGAGNFTVSSTAGDHPQIGLSTLAASQSINRYWTLTRDSVNITANASNSVAFTYVDPADYDPSTDFNMFYASRYNAPTWTEIEPSARTNTAVTISGTGITAASISGDYQIARLTSQLSCVLDSFTGTNGAAPGGDWTTSSSSGTFGAPVIFGNRLRMTNNSGNVATIATLQRLFPGAGNRIELQFQHFAYGGTNPGADGIAVVLSNAAITPVPGGYGGSLGYAQYTGSISGFAGGWIGIGIDEWGNFSNPTESRIGGPGQLAQSVAVRGSGSGMTGYIYHRGTTSLTPNVDGNGAASPPHKYRVIVDHTDGLHAYVSVERDTGSGYIQLIAPYDAKAESGQDNVPADWKLSITGSTGGSNNIHEIDNLMICATQIPVPVARYVMDEALWNGSANEVADSSGNNTHGVAVGGAQTSSVTPAITGSPGTCRYGVFDGTNDYMQVAGLSSLLNETASLAFWIKTTQTGNDQPWQAPGVTGVEQNGGANDIFWGWIDATGHIGVSVGNDFTSKSVTAINDGVWHHVVLTRDHVAGQYKIYIDGNLNSSGSIATGTITTPFSSIGRIEDTGGTPMYFNGQLDEIWIYDGVVSDSTVTAIMNNMRTCVAMGPDHYSINHAGTGVTCLAEQVTITAHDISHAQMDAGTVAIDLSTSTDKGEWTGVVSGTGTLNNSGNGEATYTFPGGENSVTLWFNYTNIASGNSESFYFDVSDGSANDAGNGNAEDQQMTFGRTGFRFYNVTDDSTTIPTQIANKPSNVAPLAKTLALQAVRSSDENPAVCTAAFNDGDTVTIDLGVECQSPASCGGQQMSVVNNSIATSLDTNNDNGSSGTTDYEPVNLLFGADSAATIVLNYPDVGSMQLHARYNIPLENGNPSGDYMIGMSNSFVVRPFGFAVANVRNASNILNPGADVVSGTVFTSAGTDFSASIRAYVWEAADDNGSTCDMTADPGCAAGDGIPDTNADLSDNNGGNATAPNFQGAGAANVTLNAVQPFEPAAGVLGQLLDSTSGMAPVIAANSFAGGNASISTIKYMEVGSVVLKAETTDYMGTGSVSGRSSNHSENSNDGAVGRFIPYDFDVALTTPPVFAAACSAFTYIGQPFNFGTPGKMTVTARAKGGSTTLNYAGDFNRLSAGSLNFPGSTDKGFREGSVENLGLDTGLLSPAWGPAINATGNGLTELDFSFQPNERITFNRTAPVAPFDAEISVEVNVEDQDGVFYGDGSGVSLNPAKFGNTGAGQGIAFTSDKEQRWGRLVMTNAFGSELLPLGMNVQAEYYLDNTAGFVPSTGDNCTVYQANAAAVQDVNLSDTLTTADVGVLAPAGSTTLINGVYNAASPLILSSPIDSAIGPGTGKTGSMQVILDLSVTGLMQQWLQFDWDDTDNLGNGPYDGNPSGRASFGIYRGSDDFIYIREPWN